MKDNYDVIICGAGPAGSTAAAVLAAGGASVLLLDRSRFPREKLCGGALTKKSMLLIERVFADKPGDLEAAGAVDAKAHAYAIRHLDEDMIAGRLDYPLHFAKRSAFDKRLLDHALEAGAESLLGEKIVNCAPDKGSLETSAGRRFTARFVIGADGAASLVRRSIKPALEYRRGDVAMGIEAYLSPESFSRPFEFPVLHFGVVSAGYGWVFPTGHGMATGVCGLNRLNPDMGRLFEKYLEFVGVNAGVKPSAHLLPYGSFIERPVSGRVLLAGDAAGYADCLLGEGLYYAMRSGEAAGHAILAETGGGSPAANSYPELLKRDVLDELEATRKWRKVLFRYQQNMRPRWPLVPLMSLFGDRLAEMVQGERSFRWGRKRDLVVPR